MAVSAKRTVVQMVGSSASLPEMNPRAATNVSAKTRLHVPL